jgi:hypothetical protein
MIPIEQPLRVDMGEIRFLGSTDLPGSVMPGERLSVGLYWRARAQPKADYQIALQLRDKTGRISVDQTQQPAAGAYPTLRWQAGEILLDWHDLELPADMAAGTYDITVVLQETSTRAQIGQANIGKLQVKK